MSQFVKILSARNQSSHIDRPFWSYSLSDLEFLALQEELQQVRPYSLDPRDAAFYFAEWWKRKYNGGAPSIQDVFDSLGRPEAEVFNAKFLYEIAQRGAQMLRVKWIRKQNTLYLRTLLLQGGIPVNHISANKSYYLAFLLRLMELKPNSIADISLRPDITKLLPASSRNKDVYENCLGIIQSILNNEDTYTRLFESNTGLKEISDALQIHKQQLNNVPKITRPKIFWKMRLGDEVANIYLHMGLGNIYSAASLSDMLNLNDTADARSYQLYLDGNLICSFARMIGGDYKTDWENQKPYRWNPLKLSPQFSCICNNERREITNLITIVPSTEEPTLWTGYGDNEWRLVKGNAINSTSALLLAPVDWQGEIEDYEAITINALTLRAISFEGEISLAKEGSIRNYYSNIDSFEWDIISDKPCWMRKADMAVITRQLRLRVYDNEGKIVAPKNYKVHYKSAGMHSWMPIDSHNKLSMGLIDIKVEYNGIKAYDRAFNIGDLTLNVSAQKLDSATLEWAKHQAFTITVAESSAFFSIIENTKLLLTLRTEHLSVPNSIPFTLKYKEQRVLHFDIYTPFTGIGLVDRHGVLIGENTMLSLNDLHGISILTNSGETTVRLWNTLRNQVKISKNIQSNYHPLIELRDDLKRLFFLADAMKHDNRVTIELSNGVVKRTYSLKGFSHAIDDVSTQFERKIKPAGENVNLQLYAVPLNCLASSIQLHPMATDDKNFHHLPEEVGDGQFIIISEFVDRKQLQPRFINTNVEYVGKAPTDRISKYHSLLVETDYTAPVWQELQAYYGICTHNKIPFSTFDQIRAIGRSSALAIKAFFYLGINQEDTNEFIQQQVAALEQDLGFCFHWGEKKHWEAALFEAEKWVGTTYASKLFELMAKYFQENQLKGLCKFIGGQKITDAERISNQIVNDARCKLGERVLSELPRHAPSVKNEYNIPVAENKIVKLLLRSPIAVSESIKSIAEKSIWEDDKDIASLRRNIQYAHFIAPELYTKVLYHCLSY